MILVDRSRYVRRLRHCARAAWLEYDYDGVGLRPKGEAIPLATGGAVHKPVEHILKYARDNNGELAPRDLVREWIKETTDDYKKRVAERGYEDETAEGSSFVVGEQCALVEGLVWAAYRVFFPWLLGEFRILDVEREEVYVVGCDCRIGDGQGSPLVMNDRGHVMHRDENGPEECAGIAIMSRPDFVAERLSDGALVVWDTKTSSYAPREEEFKIQFAFGTLGVEARLGREVSGYYVFSLLKGKRDFQSKDDREGGGLKKQQSPICYAYYRSGDPPFNKEEWRFEYTREKGFQRVPTWLSPVVQNAGGIEALVGEMMTQTQVEELINVGPPQARPSALIGEILQEIAAEEQEWAFKKSQVAGIEDPMINSMIRRSWDCDDYYGRPCEFRGICGKHPGWDKPEKMGRWVARVPNHQHEKEGWEPEVVKARGWEVQEDSDV